MHHFQGLDPQDVTQGLQVRSGLIEEYQIAGIDNCNELLGNFSVTQIFNVLVECINQRNFGKWSMLLGVVESDWVRVNKAPQPYDEPL